MLDADMVAFAVSPLKDINVVLNVPFVMRDVTLWAFTTEFFAERPDETD